MSSNLGGSVRAYAWQSVTALLIVILTLSGVHARAAVEEISDVPKVRVTTPAGAAYVIGGSGSEKKILIGLEITDVAGVGIQLDDSKMPRFVDPNHNVDMFLDYIVEKDSYTNHFGQEVMQFVSLVPLDKLKLDSNVTPPIDYKKLRPSEGERKIPIPPADMAQCAMFKFQVKDLRGVNSDRDAGVLSVAWVTGLFSPAPQ